MAKVRVIDKKSEKSIKYERELLSRLKHPFLVNMYYAFQDYENLYLVMDLLTGGDLRYHICRHRRFSEEQTRFFIACIILGLEYIHSNKVIHRDIKPENLVLDDKGYIRITDFGIAKLLCNKNSHETSGTPGYMSPEVMKGQNHTMVVDYFALGVIGYELMLGRRPYVGRSRKEIKEQMMAKQAYIKIEDVPEGWSEEAVDFINALLQRKPEKRLGFKGIEELKKHPWLNYYPWTDLYEKKLESPFVPERKENYDKKYCNSTEKIGLETQNRFEQYKLSQNFPYIFQNFTYYPMLDTVPTEQNIKVQTKNIPTGPSKGPKGIFQYTKKRCQSATMNKLFSTNVNRNNSCNKRNTKINSLNLTGGSRQFLHNKVLTPTGRINKSLNKDNISTSGISQSFLKHIRASSHNEKKTSISKGKIHSNSKTKIQRSNSNFGVSVALSKGNIVSNTLNMATPKGKIVGLNVKKMKEDKPKKSNEKLHATINVNIKKNGDINYCIKSKNYSSNQTRKMSSSSSVNMLFKNYRNSSNSINTTGNSSTGNHNSIKKHSKDAK